MATKSKATKIMLPQKIRGIIFREPLAKKVSRPINSSPAEVSWTISILRASGFKAIANQYSQMMKSPMPIMKSPKFSEAIAEIKPPISDAIPNMPAVPFPLTGSV